MANFFECEVADGISELIMAQAAVHETCEIVRADKTPDFVIATNLEQPDLHYNKSLLVKTGFNRNWDFFPAMDTWLARATPVDKLVDIGHNREDIIGHQTEAVCIDDSGNIIEEAEYVANGTCPESFSIIDTDVIYLIRGTKEKTAEINTMLDEISKGEWWVSMEAKFANFDYITVPMVDDAMKADMSKAELIERTEKTSHLSKYLRCYNSKANNVYEGKRIGRVLRQITFAGKGYVRVPANPTSAVYTFDGVKLSNKVSKVKASLTQAAEIVKKSASDLVYNNSEPLNKDIKMEEELKTVKAELATATAKLAKANEDAADADKAKKLLEDEKAKVTHEADEAKKKLEEAQVELDKTKAELATIAAAKRFDGIVKKVKDTYKDKVDEAKAVAIAETLKGLDDKVVEANLAAVASTIVEIKPTIEVKPVVKPEAPVVADLTVAAADKVVTPVVAAPVDEAKVKMTKVQGELASLFNPKTKAPK